jgi:dGTPase
MDWDTLLSTRRLGKTERDPMVAYRSPFEVDLDRITFSAAFRRMSDKMQVHGQSGNDNVRTRLTHSLEVSRVGRSLGAWVGRDIVQRLPDGSPFTAADIGHIVAAAAAAHDIGTPPFGHQGESVISDWFARSPLAAEALSGMSIAAADEYRHLEGNACGFRLLTALQGWRKNGGLQLTAATLGAFTKYPWDVTHRAAHHHKYGYMETERAAFATVAGETGLLPGAAPGTWCRHPLAYLVEAADDLCYAVVDVEDAVEMRCLTIGEAEELLFPLVADRVEYNRSDDIDRRIVFLRSRAIDTLVRAAAAVFIERHEDILGGKLVKSLVLDTPHAAGLETIATTSRVKIYGNAERCTVDLIAWQALTTILDAYVGAFLEHTRGRASAWAKAVLRTFPGFDAIPPENERWLRAVIDYIVGMTDGFAVRRAEILAGVG